MSNDWFADNFRVGDFAPKLLGVEYGSHFG